MPQLFYAVLEGLEQGEEDHVYLDCILAKNFDEMASFGTLAQYNSSDGVEYVGNILKVRRADLGDSLIGHVSRARGRTWLKVVVAEEGEPSESALIPAEFVSLAVADNNEAPPGLRISAPENAGPEIQAQAERFFQTTADDVADFDALRGELQSLMGAEQTHVVAYHVGQGNCNAIVNEAEHPIVFFDFGWPIQTNAAGAPEPAPALLSVPKDEWLGRPPIVLSHWDWDHWAYALNSWSYDRSVGGARPEWKSGALRRPWLVPPDIGLKLGPSHHKLMEDLRRQSKGGIRSLHVWPTKEKSKAIGNLVLLRCSPPKGVPRSRNDSGLAAVVRINDGSTSGWVLLPGDADFRSIPLRLVGKELEQEPLVGMVASHHGGKLPVFSIPETRAPGARLVVSTGHNHYGHPSAQMLANYGFLGWKDQVRTDLAVFCSGTGSCGAPHQVGAVLVQPAHFAKPQCGCGEVPEARMSIQHSWT